MNINEIMCPGGREYIFASSAHGTATIIDKIVDHHKGNHNKFHK